MSEDSRDAGEANEDSGRDDGRDGIATYEDRKI